jgi:hypothetical protein
MDISTSTPRTTKTIGGIEVQVPAPYAEGQVLTPILAAILNQTFAENISNNLREKLKAGILPEGAAEGTTPTPYDSTTAQPLVDAYVAEYEPGVRRGGSGEPRVTDPVEREARKIARLKATEFVKAAGGKPADYDMGELTDKVFQANKDVLMAEGKKIVKANEAAAAKAKDGMSFEGIDLTPKAPAAAAEANAA